MHHRGTALRQAPVAPMCGSKRTREYRGHSRIRCSHRQSLLVPGRFQSGVKEIPMSDIAERVRKVVVEHLGVEPAKVVDAAHFIDDLGADSLDIVELIMSLEEEFDLEITDDVAEGLVTVGAAREYLEKRAQAKAA
jgi:acyl carrier protein